MVKYKYQQTPYPQTEEKTYDYGISFSSMFPGIQRDSREWFSFYKIRTSIERAISHFELNMCIASRYTRSHTTTKAEAFLAGIASQLTVIVAYRMGCYDNIRSLKPFIAWKDILFLCYICNLWVKCVQISDFYVNPGFHRNHDGFFSFPMRMNFIHINQFPFTMWTFGRIYLVLSARPFSRVMPQYFMAGVRGFPEEILGKLVIVA